MRVFKIDLVDVHSDNWRKYNEVKTSWNVLATSLEEAVKYVREQEHNFISSTQTYKIRNITDLGHVENYTRGMSEE